METWEQIVLMRTWECSWWRWRTGLPGAACPSYWWVWAGRLWTVRIQPVPLQMKAKHHINKTKYMYTVLWPAVQLIDIGNEFSVSLSYVQWFKNHFLSLNFVDQILELVPMLSPWCLFVLFYQYVHLVHVLVEIK